MSTYLHLLVLAGVVSADGSWVFKYPYRSDGSCECKQASIPAPTGYESEESCLANFAESDLEYCRYNGLGINEDNCDYAVSVAEGMTNADCAGKCTQLVADVLPLPEFQHMCKFETYADYGPKTGISVSSTSCFSDRVYGWKDYNAQNAVQQPPLRIFADVQSPAKCQELCQSLPACALFSWRAMQDPDTEEESGSFQSPAHTCLLYDTDYVNTVLNTPIDSSASPTAYCDISAVSSCLQEPWLGNVFAPFEKTDCLLCDCEPRCVYRTVTHVTGPAFCTSEPFEGCHVERPAWTSTMPPCVEESTVPSEELMTSASTGPGSSPSMDTTASEESTLPGQSVGIETTVPGANEESSRPGPPVDMETTPSASSAPAGQPSGMETPGVEESTRPGPPAEMETTGREESSIPIPPVEESTKPGPPPSMETTANAQMSSRPGPPEGEDTSAGQESSVPIGMETTTGTKEETAVITPVGTPEVEETTASSNEGTAVITPVGTPETEETTSSPKEGTAVITPLETSEVGETSATSGEETAVITPVGTPELEETTQPAEQLSTSEQGTTGEQIIPATSTTTASPTEGVLTTESGTTGEQQTEVESSTAPISASSTLSKTNTQTGQETGGSACEDCEAECDDCEPFWEPGDCMDDEC